MFDLFAIEIRGDRESNRTAFFAQILIRSRRGLIDSAIDEDIDGEGLNFLEFFKPFSLAITTTRYFIVKNIIYLR